MELVTVLVLSHSSCCFSSSFPSELHKKKELPVKKKLLEPRADPDVFAIFCNSFISCLVGKITYRGAVSAARIAEYVSISNEAYALVYLENSYDRWEAEAVGALKLPDKKWTRDPQAATLYKGWSQDGILRYNELSKSVRDMRKQPDTKKFEGDFRDQMKEGFLQKGKKKPEKIVEESLEPLIMESSSEEESDDDDESDADS